LTFLYFYYLLAGSQSETDVAKDKVVVIDDPISSLDNDVLFIVSTLIRNLIQDVRESKSSIQLIFILTHNIYFHKEVTFSKKRNNGVFHEETFWLIKKDEKVSFIEKQSENLIKTSYELLWDTAFSEDFYTPLDTVMVQKYLNVFKQIFQKTEHIAHYNMMMRISGSSGT
jgi:wobble nucleotide-excising tRNase